MAAAPPPRRASGRLYCLSKIATAWYFLPLAFFALVVRVNVLPWSEIDRTTVPTGLPPSFRVLLTVELLTFFREIPSQSCEPEKGYSLPSYLKVDFCDIAVPSAETPVTLSEVPSAD